MRNLQLSVMFLVALLVIAALSCAGRDGNQVIESEAATTVPSTDILVPVAIQPEPLWLATPVYPMGARVAGVVGTVYVSVFVDKKGDVLQAVIYEDSGTDVGFEEAALESARDGKWKPALTQDGKPVGVWVVYPISFRLSGEKE